MRGRLLLDAVHQPHVQQPSTYAKPEAASTVLGSWWWAVCLPETCWASYKYEINFDTLLHLVEFFIWTVKLIPWSTVLPEKLTGPQLVNKFPAFCVTRRYITVLTSAIHLSLSWAGSIQSMPPHPTSWRYILILYSHVCLGLSSGLFPSRLAPQNSSHYFCYDELSNYIINP